MALSTKLLTILVLASLGLNLVMLLILAAAVGRRPGGGRQPSDFDDMVRGVLEGHARSLEKLEGAVRQLAGQDRALGRGLRGAVQHVGLIRYDAFAEMGGRLSFSCALLDGRGSGVVITSINGRQDTRVYAKPVREGRSSHNLSEEEEQAIQQALSRPREAVRAQ
jgi:hypothetical protein